MRIEDVKTREFLKNNRKKLFDAMPANSFAIVTGGKEKLRGNDTHYAFCQDRNFLYLTGLDEPDATAVFIKDANNNTQFILFTLPLNPKEEQFTAARIGLEKAKSLYGANQAFENTTMDEKIKELCQGKPEKKEEVIQELTNSKTKFKDDIIKDLTDGKKEFKETNEFIRKCRLIKTDYEIKLIREATIITIAGHLHAMSKTHPGMNENDVQRKIENAFNKAGCKELSYASIVAGGGNSYFLHYHENNAPLNKGDLLLIDAAAEKDGMCSDITTTFPIDNTFSEAQKAIYNLVLKANRTVIQSAKCGNPFSSLYDSSLFILTKGALDLGLLKGDLEKLMEEKAICRFYPHGLGHWLGWNVHDDCPYRDEKNQSLSLQPNMVFTVEPGLYIPKDAEDVEPKWRGIGVRIEDVVLMTANGAENLSASLPRTVEAIEAFIQKTRVNNNVVASNVVARQYNIATSAAPPRFTFVNAPVPTHMVAANPDAPHPVPPDNLIVEPRYRPIINQMVNTNYSSRMRNVY